MCNHTRQVEKNGKEVTESAVVAWHPNNGRTEKAMLIRGYNSDAVDPKMLFDIAIPYLSLCTVCGATFATGTDKDNRRRTAATLRELEALAHE